MKAKAQSPKTPPRNETVKTPPKAISPAEQKLFAFLDQIGQIVVKIVPVIDRRE